MYKTIRSLFKNLLVISFLICAVLPVNAAQDYTHLYNQALQDAMLAEDDEICADLVNISPDNQDLIWQDGKVLAVTWTNYPQSYPAGQYITTWWGDTWVTAVPELKNFIVDNQVNADNMIRVKQVLGLPANSKNQAFAELWVDPDDLFRPSADNEVTDSSAQADLTVCGDDSYRDWYNKNILSSYFSADKYPWTRLGYTYDWGNPVSEVGLSEFVIRKNARVLVKDIYSNEAYTDSRNYSLTAGPATYNSIVGKTQRQNSADNVFQISTINALLQGVYDGSVSCGELKKEGNFGIGTLHALDGEMVMKDGVIYQVKSNGKVVIPDDQARLPFAAVTFFEADAELALADVQDLDELQRELLTKVTNPNLIYAFRIDGEFSHVKTRSVPAQEKPYPPLTAVTSRQPTFDFYNTRGSLIGFWCPQYIQGINVPGFHLHFISEDNQQGGHLLACEMVQGTAQIDACNSFQMNLPLSQEFKEAELAADQSNELEKAEKN